MKKIELIVVVVILFFMMKNSTAQKSEKYDKRFHQSEIIDPELPRVLLVGNSICSGYYLKVRELLKGKANVDAWTTGSNIRKPTIAGDQQKSLSYGPYDVIHFNTGLHGLGTRIPTDEYEPLLRKYVENYREMSPNSKLIWASITPVRKKGTTILDDDDDNKLIAARNLIAAKVMTEHSIPINDLYALAIKHLDLGKQDGTHWLDEASWIFAKQIAKKVMAAIDAKSKQAEWIKPDLKDVKYGPHKRNVLNLWKAKSDKPTPVVVIIHGGGWGRGSKSEVLKPESQYPLWASKIYLDKGISVVSISYRLTPDNILPTPVYDAARAIQFIRFMAKEWNIDKSRLAVAGGSAGATTSLWLAYHDDLADPKNEDPVLRESTKPTCAAVEAAQTCIDPKIVVDWVGEKILDHFMIPYSVGEKDAESLMANYDKHKDMLREFSPYFHVDKNDPPTFLYGFGSTKVPARSAGHAIHHPVMSWKLKQKADSVGAECDFVLRTTRRKINYNKVLEDFIIAKLLAPTKSRMPDKKITYKNTKQTNLKLHTFLPPNWKASDKRTAIVFFFGGGWVGGSPGQFYSYSRDLANKGLVAFSAEYRVNRKHGTSPFECVADGKTAVRYIREHAAELGIDPDKIIAGGGSAGGHVAACTGVIKGFDAEKDYDRASSVPNAMILMNPVIDCGPNGYGYDKLGDRYKEISPVEHVHSGIVPTLFFHGIADTTVPFKNAEDFTAKMKAAGNYCKIVPFKGMNHGFFNFGRNNNVPYYRILKEIDMFLEVHGLD
jgi:acetyl esterase/lipase